jgi:hypothetical protein
MRQTWHEQRTRRWIATEAHWPLPAGMVVDRMTLTATSPAPGPTPWGGARHCGDGEWLRIRHPNGALHDNVPFRETDLARTESELLDVGIDVATLAPVHGRSWPTVR